MNLPENLEINTLEELMLTIHNQTEWLSTTEGDEVECISIENLDAILIKYFKNQLNSTENGN